MAAQSKLMSTALGIQYKNGIDAAGKDIIKTKKFTNIKVTANPDALLSIGTKIGSLMEYEFVGILRSDDSAIVDA